MSKVLLADDDKSLAVTLAVWLKDLPPGNIVEVVHSGDEAWHYLRSATFDLVILDWQMPGMEGVEVVRKFRGSGGLTPILMLTGNSSPEEKELGLDAGADDYLTKPFNYKELGARVRALLRRQPQIVSEVMTHRYLQVNQPTRKVKAAGVEVALQPMEFDVLVFFLRHPKEILSIDAIISHLWENELEVTEQAVYSCIKRLRKKLDVEGQPSIFENIYGQGYVLKQV